MANKTVHFKLYKGGKKWLCMAIAVSSVALGINFTSSVHADENGATNVNSADVINSTAQKLTEDQNNKDDFQFVTTSNQAVNENDQESTTQTNTTDEEVNNSADNTPENGWNSDHSVFYQNGKEANGYIQSTDGNYYMFKNGVRQDGVQKWMGTYYYFDPTTYLRVDNDYREQVWQDGTHDWYMFGKNGQIVTGKYNWQGNVYYFDPSSYLKVTNDYRATESDGRGVLLGNDGAALSGVQKWMGTYYYFDPVTKLRVDNSYVQSQWGLWYMFGNNGQIIAGRYDWQGSTYYFDPSSYLKVVNDYRATEWDGRGVLLGSDGRALSGLQKWVGTYYFFDPVTHLRVDNDYREYVWADGTHDWYMFGNDGRIVQGFYRWQRTLYWFDPSSYLVLKNSFFNGSGYWGDWDDHYADVNGAVHSVAYFSQFRPINAPEGCAAASLAMLLSIKNEWPSLSYLYNTLPQYGGVYSAANFRGILSIDSLAAYAQKFDSNIKNIKGASLGDLSNVVLSGHPVLYYGWSSYETVWTGRNHAKLIIGAHNGYYHVIDPCYFYRSQRAYTMGDNRYDWGADSWQTWGNIASEYAGSALTIL
jgi:uncharacterized protein YvpB/glucan-binding YG repeat protein